MTETLTGTPSSTLQVREAASRSLALEGFQGSFGSKTRSFPSDRIWKAFRDLGSMLWLDTGDFDAVSKLWTAEFTHATTNNTLVNQEIQKGHYDDLIVQCAARLRGADPSISGEELVREVGFILNCRVALRLVGAFDAHVSVELHPAVARDVNATVHLARRYYAVCPERFLVKIPMTPAGFLSVRQVAAEGIPINYTLGFSARQNCLAAVVSKPRFVNVFMGRLNQFVTEAGLGDGKYVGEKATLATQLALWRLRDDAGGEGAHLIGASTRSAEQVIDLAGLDVFTLPPKVAADLNENLLKTPARLSSCAHRSFDVKLSPGVKPEEVGLSNLWTVSHDFKHAIQDLAKDPAALSSPRDLVAFLRARGFGDMFHDWSEAELRQLREDGKIPKFERWKDGLKSGEIGLDDLMSVSALESFATDQGALDARIRSLAAV